LIKAAQDLKKENAQLVSERDQLLCEKKQLVEQLSMIEENLVKDKEESFQEKKLTSKAVDELIYKIDLLVKNENYSNGR
jgi:regulator of replication initiation timing